MSFSVEGVLELDARLCDLRQGEMIAWLQAGFRSVENNDPDQLADSFKPLVINPDRDAIAQLGTALREAEAVGLHGTSRMRRIVRSHLERVDLHRHCTAAELARFWQILASIRCEADLHATARIFIRNALKLRSPRRETSDDRVQSFRPISEAMVSAVVASRPLSNAQLSFFNYIRKLPPFWSSRLVGLIVDCEFEVARSLDVEEPEATWQGLLDRYRDDLEQEASPSTPAGRALLRSIARRVGMAPENEPTIAWDTLMKEDADLGRGGNVTFEPSKVLELADDDRDE